MTIDEQLAAAHELIAGPDPTTTGLWPRAAALLGRQALERALNAYWERRAPGVQHVSGRAQLLCLPNYLSDQELAGDIAYAWSALSMVCHHHAYNLGPAEPELRHYLEIVARAVRRLTPDEVLTPDR